MSSVAMWMPRPAEGFAADWDLEHLWEALRQVYPVGITIERASKTSPAAGNGVNAELLREQLMSDAHHAYDQREEALGSTTMREVERRVVLSVLDRKWREHLYEMDYLQEGIGLRAMAQRDPLIEYQREGFQLFEAMMDAIKEESVSHLFSVQVEVTPPATQVGATPMSVSDLVGGLAEAACGGARGGARGGACRCRASGCRAGEWRADSSGRGRQRQCGAEGVRTVKVSGVDLATRHSGLRPALLRPGRGRPGRRDRDQPVERKADRRGKKVKRRRR